MYDQFILFGDSITQAASNQERGFGLGAALQHAYIRKLDVINRGFNGYNTNQALQVLPHIIPPASQAKVRFLAIFFGANDSRLPDSSNGQDVSPAQFEENLRAMIAHPAVQAHKPRIILITPPPIEETLQEADDIKKGYPSLRRSVQRTKEYADLVLYVGQKMEVPVVHLWRACMREAHPEWMQAFKAMTPGTKALGKDETLEELMYDGLHLSPKGYEVLFRELMKEIQKAWPRQMPDNLPHVLPKWDDVEAWQEFDRQNKKGIQSK